MNTKEKIAGIIIGAGAGIIFAIIGFLIYINNDTVKADRQPELSQIYLPEEEYEQETEAAEAAVVTKPTETATATKRAETAKPQKTGFVVQNGEIYYYDTSGNLITGWFDYNNTQYYADEDGKLYKEGAYEVDDVTYYFGRNGICFGEAGDANWKSAYLNYLQSNADGLNGGFSSCALMYIDNDDIPEMALYGIDGAHGNIILNYSEGTVYETYLARNYFTYIERANLLCNSWVHMGVASDTVYSIIDEKMTVIAEGYVYFGYDDGEDNDSYEWNGKEVTETKYYEELGKIYDSNKATSDYPKYTYDEIVDVLTNFE